MAKQKPKELSTRQLKRIENLAADLPGLMEYAHSVGGFSVVPTKEGVIKNTAMKAMQSQTQMQLDQLLEQMKFLAQQAQKIKERVHVSEEIYQAKLNFKPIIGGVYFLYRRKNKNSLLSMIGPEEWNNMPDEYEFAHKVELLADHTWKILESSSF